MKNVTQLVTKNESFLASQYPISDNLQHALQCTVWIDEHGYIQDSFGQIEEMFGYWFEELKDQHISLLLPDLAHTELLSQNRINSILLFRCHCSIPFRGLNRNGHEHNYIVFMNLLSNQLGHRFTMTIRDHVP
jgi:PAS domain S-box-containing protein